jgi:hypothetical protein
VEKEESKMFAAYLFWIFAVVGGLFMGGAALLSIVQRGFDTLVAANLLLYAGIGLYAVPRLIRMHRKLKGASS